MAYGQVIAAISTPPGKGGVAIIRISGEGAIEVADRAFIPRSGRRLCEYPSRTQVYGEVIYDGERIDDGLATVFRAPSSYTGEDTVEISCHGGVLITKTVLEAVLAAGASYAEAGEFTKRAYINGRLSLAEAESIGNLLEAQSREQIRLSTHVARERLGKATNKIRDELIPLLSSTYARIDYPDEDLGEFDTGECLSRLYAVRDMIDELTRTYPTGRAISEGVRAVIAGKPNVGKSTIYNALLGEDAAIVTDIEGTTRDVLTDSVVLGKVMLRLSDTAGLRQNERADAVERIGIERTRAALENAELVLAVFDGGRCKSDEDDELISLIKSSHATAIAIINKSELDRKFDTGALSGVFERIVEISARDDEGDAVSKIADAVEALFIDEKINTSTDAVITSARHNAALCRTAAFVKAAIDAYESCVYQDAASSEIERAIGAISELDGRAVCDEVVSDIFSKFCVGK